MKDRQYTLGLMGETWRGSAPNLRTAIERAEAESGRRVWAGGSDDNGIPSFDPADDLRQFMATHRRALPADIA